MSDINDSDIKVTPVEAASADQPIPKRNRYPITRMVIGGVLAIALLAGVFWAGRYSVDHGQSASAANSSQTSSGPGEQYGRRGSMQRLGERGQVTAVSSSSITIQSTSGSSKTYTIDSSTAVRKAGASAAVSDIASGDTVSVRASGTTAKTINIMDGSMMSPGGNPGDSGTSDPSI